ncbi:hypothetical protein BGZ50_009769 [Haplosporangium sp. Z 11]|nr:hypothetical protein BGZ50_009769 [Haplosporangium sp. Z 11]
MYAPTKSDGGDQVNRPYVPAPTPTRKSEGPSSHRLDLATTSVSAFFLPGTAGISPKTLSAHPTQLSLARDLTTRLWQREAELQIMKELYDAKIRRLTEMLQDAGVSPAEVEDSLAGVIEETDDKRPLFDQLSVTNDFVVERGQGAGGDIVEDGLMSEVYEEDCNSIVLEEENREEDEFSLSSSGTLSLLSSSTTRPDVSRQTSRSMLQTEIPSLVIETTLASTNALKAQTTERQSIASRTARPFSPAASDISSASYQTSSRQQQQRQEHQKQVPDQNNDTRAAKAQSECHETALEHGQGQRGPGGLGHENQSQIPSFIAESFAAGTLSIRTLREKWAVASGVLSWNRPKSGHRTMTNSCNSSHVASPSGLSIRNEGIMNDKKPALVEASIPPPMYDGLMPVTGKGGRESDKDKESREWDLWASIVSPTSRKHAKGHVPHARPMSDVLSSRSKYPALTMARNIPCPPINRTHNYLQRPETFNPSPLHYRAISMAANLIDTGAITPARLYARRTQTMIAKWTLGLIINNSKPARSTSSSFPIIRESLSIEHIESMGYNCTDKNGVGADDQSAKENPAAMEMVSSYDRRSGALSPKEIPKALSFKSHSTTPSLAGSYQHSSPLHFYQPHNLVSTQSVVELSDISSPPLSISPSFSYLGDTGKPLTDRYGFLVSARPMAVQQGLMKLNEAYANDDLDLPSSMQPTGTGDDGSTTGENGNAFESLRSSSGDSMRSTSPPPIVSSFYIGHSQGAASSAGGGGSSAAGNATTSTSSLPSSVTSPILSTSTRPTSTLSPPTSSSATVTTLLSQIKVLHDSVQMTQKEKWDAFLRKRRRRVHMGETNGGALANMSGTHLGSPLFGSFILSLEEQEQDDEDAMYWTSVCIIGIATMGKGSDWEEFRDLARGGIPVMYRNKIWQEASGAYDMRQPGYYKELLSRQALESCQCWGDIEMDLHRTFPTNVLFGPGGHGIGKLKNILIAYSLHNPIVGYCQGMNLLAGTLLLTNNSEEEAFWILTSMLSWHLPEDYFTQQLLSPQADQRVLRELVQEIMPRLSQHFQDMHVDLTAITFSWFLTLFTDCLPVETLLRVWDVFFVEGMMIVFKIAVAILWMNEKEILKCRNGAAVYCFMKQMTLGMHQADKLMKVAFVTLKSYIHPEKIEAKRQHHRKMVRREMIEEQERRLKRKTTLVSS